MPTNRPWPPLAKPPQLGTDDVHAWAVSLDVPEHVCHRAIKPVKESSVVRPLRGEARDDEFDVSTLGGEPVAELDHHLDTFAH